MLLDGDVFPDFHCGSFLVRFFTRFVGLVVGRFEVLMCMCNLSVLGFEGE